MYRVSPDQAYRAYYKVFRLPMYGELLKDGSPLLVGSLFTQADLNTGRIEYRHLVPLQPNEVEGQDCFDFTLWDPQLGTIRAGMYGPCMPPRRFETTSDGIFRFVININRPTMPTSATASEPIVLRELQSLVITNEHLFTQSQGYNSEQIVHTLKAPLRNGYLTLRGQPAQAFTQADIDAGVVVYHNTQLGDGVETILVESCNFGSRCISNQFGLTIMPRFKQVGDNVLYAKTNSLFSWTFSATDEALWLLKGGSNTPPKNALHTSNYLIGWSSYATSSDYPDNTVERGPGYDKLPQYRNLREQLYWNGGLPEGVSVSNSGYLGTSQRDPASLGGSQPWKLPSTPASFEFTMVAVDPKTDQVDIRKYLLITTYSGFGVDGQLSESKDL